MDGAPLPDCPVLNEAREDVAGLRAVIESYEREVAVLRDGKARYRGLWLTALAASDSATGERADEAFERDVLASEAAEDEVE